MRAFWQWHFLCIAVWVWVGCAARVHASPPFELIGGALGDGGLNARTTGAGAASAYFNPALLARAAASVEVGGFVLNDVIDVTLYARTADYDVPELALSQFQGQLPSIPTAWLQEGCDPMAGGRCASRLTPHPRQAAGSSGKTRGYQLFGLVAKLHERYLTLGVYAMLPFGSLLSGRSFFPDEREQYFSNSLHPELYSDRLGALALGVGAGSQLLDWLAVGVGASLNLTNDVEAATFVGNSSRIADTLQLGTQIEAKPGVSPYLGALLTPLEGLQLSLTAHAPKQMAVDMDLSTFLPNGDLQKATRKVLLGYMPWIFGLGGQYDFLRQTHRLGVVAALTYQLWSGYLNRQGDRPQQGYEWADTLQLTAGVRHAYRSRLSSFVDVSYTPTPVPPQTGRTNYVDNDRLGFSAGVSYKFPLWSSGLALRVGAQAQLHLLLERAQLKLDPTSAEFSGRRYSQLVIDEWKDGARNNRGEVISQASGLQTNNPGWPGFSSIGSIWAGGLNVAVLF
jgi:long-chain fatty acid transport protein